MQNLGIWGLGLMGAGYKFVVESAVFADPDLPIHYATFMGPRCSLLLSIPIVKCFQSKKTVQFWTKF